MRRPGLVFSLLVACNACNSTSTTTATPPPASTPSASAAPAPAKPTACTRDEECATFSSYCGDLPCACMPYLASGGAPKCSQPNAVKCFVDPCHRKAAACQEGKCVVVSGRAGEATE